MIAVLLLDSVPDIEQFRYLLDRFDYVHVFDYAIRNNKEHDIVRNIAKTYPYSVFIRTTNPEFYCHLPVGIHISNYVENAETLSFGNPKSFSVHSVDEIPEKIPQNVIKVFVSPVFTPISKNKKAIPTAEQREIITQLRAKGIKTVIALGGITPHNASEVLCRGFDGVAFYSSFKENPKSVLKWLESVKETV